MMNSQKLLGNESDFDFKPGKQNKIILLGIQGKWKNNYCIKTCPIFN